MIKSIKSIRYGSVVLIFTYKAAFLVGYMGLIEHQGRLWIPIGDHRFTQICDKRIIATEYQSELS
jgi:hypothetical protein